MNRLQLFPTTTKIEDDSITIAGHSLAALAEAHETPLYVYDRATMDNSLREYRQALASHYPAPASITYARKAFFFKTLAQGLLVPGFILNCTRFGRIRQSLSGDVRGENIFLLCWRQTA